VQIQAAGVVKCKYSHDYSSSAVAAYNPATEMLDLQRQPNIENWSCQDIGEFTWTKVGGSWQCNPDGPGSFNIVQTLKNLGSDDELCFGNFSARLTTAGELSNFDGQVCR
jgi:hypothetical protein